MERNVLGESNVLVVASCDRTLSCLEASWVHTSLLHPLGYRGGPFWWPGRSRFSSSQQAARVDLIGQARPPYVRPATCTHIWPPERVGRAGTGSAQRPKSPVRAWPAGLVALPLAAAAPRRLHAQTRGKPMVACPLIGRDPRHSVVIVTSNLRNPLVARNGARAPGGRRLSR